jgi:hypothetical protein
LIVVDPPVEIVGRRRIDVIRETWSFTRATVKGLDHDQWTRAVDHPSVDDVGELARIFAMRLLDGVRGWRRTAVERLDATVGWGPIETADEIRRRAATIIAFYRNIPESEWTVPRRSGMSVLESTERSAFDTCVMLDALLPPLGISYDPPCLPLAHQYALDELTERVTDLHDAAHPIDLIRLAVALPRC